MAEENRESQGKAAEAQEVEKEAGLLDQIIKDSRIARSETERTRAKDLIGEFVQQVLQGSVVVSKDLESAISARIAALDEAISRQLNEVMHAPEFQKLEASWRGLHYWCTKPKPAPSSKFACLMCRRTICVRISSGRPNSTKARFSSKFTKKNTAVRWRLLRMFDRRLRVWSPSARHGAFGKGIPCCRCSARALHIRGTTPALWS